MEKKNRKIWSSPAESSDVSAELCTGLEDLGAGLTRAKANLAPRLFEKVWRGVASIIDPYLVSSILPPNAHVFRHGGVAQLVRDERALLLLFRPCTHNPESYFKKYVQTVALSK